MSEDRSGPSIRPGMIGRELGTYFGETVWRPLAKGTSLQKRIVRWTSRYLYLIVRGFVDDRVLVRAPALTLITLLACVPLLALTFSAAKGFGLQQIALDSLRQFLTDFIAVGQQDVVDVIIGYVENTSFGALGSIGLLFLIYAATSILGTMESSFNDIWGVAHNRPFHRKVTDYLSILMIFPVLVLAATGLTASSSSTALVERVLNVSMVSGAVEFGVKLLPLVVIIAGFTFIYKYMPYTHVRLRAALVAGFVAGSTWQLAQWSYIKLQIGVTSSNVIYGTFAALPIFLIWLNVSWIIVLVGCEIAYAVQHAATYHPPVPRSLISIAQREQVALQILATVWKKFSDGEPAESAGDLAAEVDLPRPVTMEILDALVRCGLLATAMGPREGLLPGRDLSRMSVGELLVAYRHAGRTSHGDLGGILHERVAALHEQLERGLRAEGPEAIGVVFQGGR